MENEDDIIEVKDISDIISEAEDIYGKYGRKKVIVKYEKNGKIYQKEEYLEEKNASNNINNYLEALRDSKAEIKRNNSNVTFKKRVIYNLIATLIFVGCLFGVNELGKYLTSLSEIAAGFSPFITFLTALTTGVIDYGIFNDKSFYYSKNELKELAKCDELIKKCNDLLGEIQSYKLAAKEIEANREEILNKKIRERNARRNYQMDFDAKKYNEEAWNKINEGVKRDLAYMKTSKADDERLLKEYDQEVERTHKEVELQKNKQNKITFKKVLKGTGKWLAEAFDDSQSYVQKEKPKLRMHDMDSYLPRRKAITPREDINRRLDNLDNLVDSYSRRGGRH